MHGHMSAATKNNVFILIVVLLSFLLTLIASVFLINKSMEMQRVETEKLQAITDQWLEKEAVELTLLTKTAEQLGYTKENREELLSLFKVAANNNPNVYEYYILFPDNTGVFSDDWEGPGDAIDLRERMWYTEARDTQPYVSFAYIDSNTGRAIATVSMAMYVENEFVGVVAVDFFISTLANSLADVYHQKDSYTILLDSDGNVLAHRDPKLITSKSNGFITYDMAGLSDDYLRESGYSIHIGKGLDVYSCLHSEKYGYSLIVATNGRVYYGSLIVFLLLCVVIAALALRHTQYEVRKSNERQHVALNEAYEAADIDYMTGILNRGAGERHITEHIRDGKRGMFCLMDADRFKSINDRFGHAVGDKVIIGIAEALRATFRREDIVMRLGGDEFAVYAPGLMTPEDAAWYFDVFFEKLSNLIIPEMLDQRATVSLGVTFYNGEAEIDFDCLYRQADSCTYKSKKIPGSVYTFYDAAEKKATV